MYQEDQRDFNLKYAGTYLGWVNKEKKVVQPFHVKTTDGMGKRARLIGNLLSVNGKVWAHTTIKVADPNLVTQFPDVGAINLHHGPVVFQRKSKRQWRKSLVGAVIQVVDPFREERKHFSISQIGGIDNKSILMAIFNPVYYTREEAFKRIISGMAWGAAINKDWYLGIKLQYPEILLFKEDLSVGTVMENGKAVYLKKEVGSLKEQILDLGFEVVLV